jgi:Spy/CpxP family protein refolding chaperone
MKSAGGSDMKRIIIWSSVGFLSAAIGIVAIRADGPMQHGWGARGCGNHGPFGYIAQELKLSDAQKSEVKTIWQAERLTIASLVHELATENNEMDAATAKGNIDDGRLQVIASRHGDTIAKLLVEKERFEARIYTRARADELEKTWHSRLDRITDRIEWIRRIAQLIPNR